ncbi:hypothetical protein A6V39_00370 [Candidatus Mycoplasma haematobovis]|uniref:DUF31 domain-containing protein n=1 Tax=Candidatus Mycoplasma haematobovis TaxID=432608 RepID=A0A1A9QEE6_9MOLU|nr:hypothetical protein [Candidatus Mycoplasma haematobovis]OAL10504.1 hypothetical protein A6V39_00370 [Candidatus Mycoplasma haematobovis]
MKGGLVWNSKQYREAGHFYKLKNIALGQGSSGGIFTDSNGDAVGIISVVATNAPHSWIAPFRSTGFVSDEFKTPPYDLILGGIEGQRTSYKQQVETFNKNTWLKAKGWNNKS